MAMAAQPVGWTVDMVHALPDDGNRYEVIDGELYVTPSPSPLHQRAVLDLALLLAPYIREHTIGEVYVAPADIVFGPRNAVQPDLFVIPLVHAVSPTRWDEIGALLLSVEVVSPSTRRTDREDKRALYQRKGVPEYWVIDADARIVERWRVDGTVEELSASLRWQPWPNVPPLEIDLAAYLARVAGK